MPVPGFLAGAFHKRVKEARNETRQQYNDYWRGREYQMAACYRCGQKCKHEPGPYDKYDPCCCRCSMDAAEHEMAKDLDERMGVC